jgi:hypothetical protein
MNLLHLHFSSCGMGAVRRHAINITLRLFSILKTLFLI